MSNWENIVKNILNENNIISLTAVKIPSYKKLCEIFNIIESLEEDSKDNEAWLRIAYDYYKKLLKKIENKEYTKCQLETILINLDNLLVFIDYDDTGSYNQSYYNSDNKTIYLYAKNIQNLKEDIYFRSNFIHEITHYLSEFEDDNQLSWNYVDSAEDEIKYYTQPTELLSNKIAVCDFLINLIEKNINKYITRNSLLNTEKLQEKINEILEKITAQPGFLYHNFLKALGRNEQELKDFYKEIIDTCIQYIQNNLQECSNYAFYNYLKECIEND